MKQQGDDMLSKDKTSFVLYTSFYEALSDLPLDRKGMLLDLIFKYEIHGDTDEFEKHFADLPNDVKMAFRFIKGQLDKDQERWREVCSKRAEAGRKGADAKWGKQDITNDNKDNNCQQPMAKIANVNFAIKPMAKMADNDNEYEYENDDVVVNNNNTRACATTATPTDKKIESYRKALKNKFYIKGEDDSFCRMVLKQAREFDQKKIQEMANGNPRGFTIDGKEVWEWSQRVDVAVGYRVWIERVVAAWDAGKYKGAAHGE